MGHSTRAATVPHRPRYAQGPEEDCKGAARAPQGRRSAAACLRRAARRHRLWQAPQSPRPASPAQSQPEPSEMATRGGKADVGALWALCGRSFSSLGHFACVLTWGPVRSRREDGQPKDCPNGRRESRQARSGAVGLDAITVAQLRLQAARCTLCSLVRPRQRRGVPSVGIRSWPLSPGLFQLSWPVARTTCWIRPLSCSVRCPVVSFSAVAFSSPPFRLLFSHFFYCPLANPICRSCGIPENEIKLCSLCALSALVVLLALPRAKIGSQYTKKGSRGDVRNARHATQATIPSTENPGVFISGMSFSWRGMACDWQELRSQEANMSGSTKAAVKDKFAA